MHPLLSLACFSSPSCKPSVARAPRAAVVRGRPRGEVQRAVTAYNARDLSYYERVLGPSPSTSPRTAWSSRDATRVLRTFGRILAPTRRGGSRISDLTSIGQGETDGRRSAGLSPPGNDTAPRRHVCSLRAGRRRVGPHVIQNT